jgi:hypothetical protein
MKLFIIDIEFKKLIFDFIDFYNKCNNKCNNNNYTKLFILFKKQIHNQYKLYDIDNKEKFILRKIKKLKRMIEKKFKEYPLLTELSEYRQHRTEKFLDYINIFYRSNKNNV